VTPDDIPPQHRTALHAALFNEWINTIPSVMERFASTPDQNAARDQKARELATHMDALRPVRRTTPGPSDPG
jgi:hypothetical protein